MSPFSESLALLSPHFSCKDQSIVPMHARPARRRCEHLPFALILKMISGTPQRRSADNRRAALAAEPQKNDPRFEHSKMHSVLRCYERPIHCPRHYPAPPSPIPNSSRSRVPGRYRGLTIEAYALDLRQRTSWYRAAPRHLFAVQVRLALPPHAAHGAPLLHSCKPEPDNLSRVALALTMITLRTESAGSEIVRAKDNVPARHVKRPRGGCCGPSRLRSMPRRAELSWLHGKCASQAVPCWTVENSVFTSGRRRPATGFHWHA